MKADEKFTLVRLLSEVLGATETHREILLIRRTLPREMREDLVAGLRISERKLATVRASLEDA